MIAVFTITPVWLLLVSTIPLVSTTRTGGCPSGSSEPLSTRERRHILTYIPDLIATDSPEHRRHHCRAPTASKGFATDMNHLRHRRYDQSLTHPKEFKDSMADLMKNFQPRFVQRHLEDDFMPDFQLDHVLHSFAGPNGSADKEDQTAPATSAATVTLHQEQDEQKAVAVTEHSSTATASTIGLSSTASQTPSAATTAQSFKASTKGQLQEVLTQKNQVKELTLRNQLKEELTQKNQVKEEMTQRNQVNEELTQRNQVKDELTQGNQVKEELTRRRPVKEDVFNKPHQEEEHQHKHKADQTRQYHHHGYCDRNKARMFLGPHPVRRKPFEISVACRSDIGDPDEKFEARATIPESDLLSQIPEMTPEKASKMADQALEIMRIFRAEKKRNRMPLHKNDNPRKTAATTDSPSRRQGWLANSIWSGPLPTSPNRKDSLSIRSRSKFSTQKEASATNDKSENQRQRPPSPTSTQRTERIRLMSGRSDESSIDSSAGSEESCDDFATRSTTLAREAYKSPKRRSDVRSGKDYGTPHRKIDRKNCPGIYEDICSERIALQQRRPRQTAGEAKGHLPPFSGPIQILGSIDPYVHLVPGSPSSSPLRNTTSSKTYHEQHDTWELVKETGTMMRHSGYMVPAIDVEFFNRKSPINSGSCIPQELSPQPASRTNEPAELELQSTSAKRSLLEKTDSADTMVFDISTCSDGDLNSATFRNSRSQHSRDVNEHVVINVDLDTSDACAQVEMSSIVKVAVECFSEGCEVVHPLIHSRRMICIVKELSPPKNPDLDTPTLLEEANMIVEDEHQLGENEQRVQPPFIDTRDQSCMTESCILTEEQGLPSREMFQFIKLLKSAAEIERAANHLKVNGFDNSASVTLKVIGNEPQRSSSRCTTPISSTGRKIVKHPNLLHHTVQNDSLHHEVSLDEDILVETRESEHQHQQIFRKHSPDRLLSDEKHADFEIPTWENLELNKRIEQECKFISGKNAFQAEGFSLPPEQDGDTNMLKFDCPNPLEYCPDIRRPWQCFPSLLSEVSVDQNQESTCKLDEELEKIRKKYANLFHKVESYSSITAPKLRRMGKRRTSSTERCKLYLSRRKHRSHRSLSLLSSTLQ
ncbi:unnamed protein product [Cyprideis torosa]|uniref:Uncharacterized protein n=1 Tax=Cyprideis torosa TaxID=163714 RepID=A0A7R8WKS5_9CRUS|nr:unnamed protein product [Cyprideis torosa]CAG0903546.1 unnamed protein product [Cyprideis torosa]